MSTDLADTMPLSHRLALSYAPAAARGANLALLLLDQRLRAIVAGGGEPAIAQIKLAWWRERLGEPRERWPSGEPLLALLQEWPGDAAKLAAMVDGWEILLSETLTATEIAEYAQGRAQGFVALAEGLGAGEAGGAARQFVLADLLLHLGPGAEAEAEADAVRSALDAESGATKRLARAMRPLAVLNALAARALRRQSAELLDGPGALFTALRIGIFGR